MLKTIAFSHSRANSKVREQAHFVSFFTIYQNQLYLEVFLSKKFKKPLVPLECLPYSYYLLCLSLCPSFDCIIVQASQRHGCKMNSLVLWEFRIYRSHPRVQPSRNIIHGMETISFAIIDQSLYYSRSLRRGDPSPT